MGTKFSERKDLHFFELKISSLEKIKLINKLKKLTQLQLSEKDFEFCWNIV